MNFCFVDRASLYNLVNKANLVDSLFLVYLLLVCLSISTCFGRLCANHQEKQLCLCDTWYLLFCVDDFIPHIVTSTKCCINAVASHDDAGAYAPEYQTVIHIKMFSQNCEKLLLASSCPSVRPHVTTRFPLDGYS